MLTELFFILLYLYLFRPVSRLAVYFTLIQCQWWLFFVGIPQVPQPPPFSVPLFCPRFVKGIKSNSTATWSCEASAFLPRSICYSSTPPWWGYWDVRPDGFLHNFLRVARLLVTPYPLTHGGWVFYLSRVKDHWNDPPSTKALSSTITRLSTISITQVAPRGGCWYCHSAGYRTWTDTVFFQPADFLW